MKSNLSPTPVLQGPLLTLEPVAACRSIPPRCLSYCSFVCTVLFRLFGTFSAFSLFLPRWTTIYVTVHAESFGENRVAGEQNAGFADIHFG
jgi:hypothetical protein